MPGILVDESASSSLFYCLQDVTEGCFNTAHDKAGGAGPSTGTGNCTHTD